MQDTTIPSPTDAVLASAFRDLETKVEEINIISDIMTVIIDNPTSGQEQLEWVVTKLAETIANFRLRYQATLEGREVEG